MSISTNHTPLAAAPPLLVAVLTDPTVARYLAALALAEQSAADPGQLRANALQLHRRLTGESVCRCGAPLSAGERRCSSCGRCTECGSVYCRAGRVTCEDDAEQRWQRYRARVAPLERIAALVSGGTRWGSSVTQ